MEKLQTAYENDPGIQAIISVFPIAQFFLPFLSTRVKEIRLERSRTLFDELSKGNIELNEEIIHSEDFIHKFYITYKASINTRRREKIKYFARLLKSSIKESNKMNVDIFEDYSKILEELSYREILSLALLDNYYTSTNKHQNNLANANEFWDDFETSLQSLISIEKRDIGSFLSRLSRSGCYELFVGQYFDVDVSRGMGVLTSTFQSIKMLALNDKD